jgi:hypothetical protein
MNSTQHLHDAGPSDSDRWLRLEHAGVLWASTGTKDPEASNVFTSRLLQLRIR